MKVLFDPQKTVKIGIYDSTTTNKNLPYLFNEVMIQVKKHKLPATFNTGNGYIELPSATQEILNELKKIGIQYNVIS